MIVNHNLAVNAEIYNFIKDQEKKNIRFILIKIAQMRQALFQTYGMV